MGSMVKFQQFRLGDRDGAFSVTPPEVPEPLPENPAEDPEAVRLLALERLAEAIALTAAEQARLRDGLICTVVQALGAAAEAMLPALARNAFAARVAELGAEIAGRGEWPDLTLSLSPDDRTAVDEAFAAHGPVAGLVLAEDARLAPGEAQFGWPAGGARIDVTAIAESALEDFRQRLDGLASRGD